MKTNSVIQNSDDQSTRTSIVCRIRNRNEIFADTIQNWLRFSVSEIIIIDFRDESCQSVWNVVQELNDPRIKVIETKYEYMFLPATAWNLGISQVASEFVLLLDVDNILYENFFKKNVTADHEFICGKPKRHLWGSCYCKKAYFDAVNGFNENCIYMGYEDEDLYNRLVTAGYSMRSYNFSTIHHKDHPKVLTICNQVRQNGGNAPKIWKSMDSLNRVLAKELFWTADSPKIQWSLEPLEQRRLLAIRDVTCRSVPDSCQTSKTT